MFVIMSYSQSDPNFYETKKGFPFSSKCKMFLLAAGKVYHYFRESDWFGFLNIYG